ncbi:hypothetical protein [Streptomyces sp. NPDC006997]|uniref:hypothetical protein n=1 Tax=Streptomyces sp. NPDC006997 TaxID=3155356 RepID=UPI003402C7A8
MSSPTPPVVNAPPAPVAPSRRPGPVVAVALAVGLLLGGGGVGVAWALSGEDAATGGAADDARAACQALDGFAEEDYVVEGARGEIAVNRFAAATVLSASAAAGDTEFKPLAKALREARARHAQTFDMADATVREPLRTARDFCAAL